MYFCLGFILICLTVWFVRYDSRKILYYTPSLYNYKRHICTYLSELQLCMLTYVQPREAHLQLSNHIYTNKQKCTHSVCFQIYQQALLHCAGLRI